MSRTICIATIPLWLAATTTGLAQTPEDQKLVVGDNEIQDFFGQSVAVSEEWALVGEHNDSMDERPDWHTGTAFFFHREAGGWRMFEQVLPSDKVSSLAFGWAVALDGRVAVVGDPHTKLPVNKRGVAYVFEYRLGRWRQTARLTPDGMDLGDRFGWSVDVDGDRVLVCATADDDGGMNLGAGYVFERVGDRWSKVAKLLPPADTWIGYECALSGETAVLSAYHKAAIIFERIAGVWRQTATLADPTGQSSHFGNSVDLDGDTLVVGAPMIPGENAPGAVAVYVRSAPGQWNLHSLRHAPQWDIGGGIGTDRFGESVAIHGDRILVGATMAPDEAGEYVGQAYLFERRPKWLKPIDRFTASDAKEGINHLGNAVALSASFALVADEVAVGATPGVRSGAAYVYERPLGESYCPAVPNSAGLSGHLKVTGSVDADAAVLDLSATGLPRHEIGVFLASRTQGFVPNPGGSDGNLCLGSPVARLIAGLSSTGEGGSLEDSLSSRPIPFDPPDWIDPGESWSFQAWYTDREGRGRSNFTDAVTVLFE